MDTCTYCTSMEITDTHTHTIGLQTLKVNHTTQGCRKECGGKEQEYLVLWTGQDGEKTWEPGCCLKDADEAMQKWATRNANTEATDESDSHESEFD